MHKYIIGIIAGILAAIATNLTAPITIINFITALFFAVVKMLGTMILCFVTYIVFLLLGRCIPIITSEVWKQMCWTWEEIKAMENSEESDAEV